MTTIDLTTLADDIGGSKLRSATITARATRPRAAGKNLTVPDVVTLKVRNGEPVEPFVLEEPDGTWAWEISVLPLGWSKRDAITGIYRFTGAEVNWADLTPIDPKTLVPLVPFPPTVQEVLDLAAAKAAAAETAAANAAAAQASSAGFAGSASDSADEAALAAATATAALVQEQSYDAAVGRLDMRFPGAVTLALCSDSTADDPNEWFETFLRESMAEIWPERPARVMRWGKTPDAYPGTWTEWQNGATETIPAYTDTNAILGADSFGRTGPLAGSVPNVGSSAWTDSAGGFTTNGSRLIKANGAGAANASFGLLPRTGTDIRMSCTMRLATNTSGTKQTLITLMRVTATARIYYLLQGSSSPTITLVVSANGASRTIETLPAGLLPVQGPTDYPVSFELSGTSATAKLNGHTSSFELTSAELTALTGAGVFWIQSTDADFQLANLEYRGTVTVPEQPGAPSDLPPVSVYNAAVAGTAASYAIPRLDAMFPVRPDLLFINHGHNYSGSVLGAEFVALIDAFVDAFHAKWPGVPIVVASENPRFPPASQPAEHLARQIALRAHAREKGWEYIPGMEAFAQQRSSGVDLVQADGIHPTYSSNPTLKTGGRIVAEVAKAWLKSRSERTA